MPYSRPCGVLYSTVKQTSFPISFFRRNSRAGKPQGCRDRGGWVRGSREARTLPHAQGSLGAVCSP